MPLLTDSSDLFSSPRWLRALAISKRTLHEGFGSFVLSIVLFTGGLVLLRVWWLHQIALRQDVQKQLLKTVSVSQEPTDANDMGLIAAALANLNMNSIDRCGGADPSAFCAPLEKLHRMFDESFNEKMAMKGGGKLLDRYPLAEPDKTRPELAEGPWCEAPKEDGGSYIMLPAQMDPVNPRIKEDVAASLALDETLTKLQSDPTSKPLFDSMVQAYFISPDSLLRIWSRLEANVCKEFSSTKLWASKNYFAYFWDHPDEKSFTTPIYIDYGGNGLVQTRCEEVDEWPNAKRDYQHERMLGAACVDFRTNVKSDAPALYNQLFFETAQITFPDTYDPNQAKVSITDLPILEYGPQSSGQTAGVTQAAVTPSKGAKDDSSQALAGADPASDRDNQAIRLQSKTLKVQEIELALKDIKKPGPALRREVTHVPFRGGTAFLIPLGPPTGRFQSLFLFPRSPALSRMDLWFQALGFGLIGAAFASAATGSRLRTRAGQLRERLGLLRSMQIGFLQVDEDNWILEANDRAEELFQRQLPKPGVSRRRVNFWHLISDRMVETGNDGDSESMQYEPLSIEKIRETRAIGGASSYYGRLVVNEVMNQERRGRGPTWLRVSATPMMLFHQRERDAAGLHIGSISATVHEVPGEISQRLEERLQEIKQAAPKHFRAAGGIS